MECLKERVIIEVSENLMAVRRLTACIEREGDGFVSLCPEVDIASQGNTIEHARANLQEALELFFEIASEAEIAEHHQA
jgi:predicted RNase H-like HicB family nuclease